MKTKLIVYGLLCVLVLGCGQAHREMESNMKASADSTASSYISSSAATENKDTSRKFIRTAELKFKVKNAVKSTYSIEDITAKHSGFVTYTNLESTINNVTNTAISADTTLETTYFTVSNTMTIRVPNTRLDTTLKEIALLVDFLDFRIIKADDVALQILSNNLTQRRAVRNEKRLTDAIDNRGKKLRETIQAEEILLSKQEQADHAKISNLSLLDQVNFSTINLSLYQRQSYKRELVPNDKNIDAYEPGLASKTWESMKSGWSVLEAVFLFLVRLWGLFLLGLIVYVLYKMYGHKLKK